MNPRQRTIFPNAGEARTYIACRGARIIARRSEGADGELAQTMPVWAHWGLVSTAETAHRASDGAVGALIGYARWVFGEDKLYVTMLDKGQLPPKGRRGRGSKRTLDGKHLRRTVRVGLTESEVSEFHAWNKAFFERMASNRTSGTLRVDGVTYTSKID